MAEMEELKLVVALDDQATPKLEQLSKTGRDFGQELSKSLGAAGNQLSRIRRDGEETGHAFKSMAESLVVFQSGFQRLNLSLSGAVGGFTTMQKGVQGVASSVGSAGLAVGAFAVSIVAAGVVLERYLKQLNDYSAHQLKMRQIERVTGVGPAYQKKAEQAYVGSGLSPEAAQADIAGATQKAEEYRRLGPLSEMGKLLQGLHGEDFAVMKENLDRVALAATATARLRAIQQGAEIERQRVARTGGTEKGAIAAAQFYEKTGAANLVNVTQPIAEPTKAQQEIADAAAKAGEEFETQKNKALLAFDELKNKFNTAVLPEITKALGPISERLQAWSESLRPEDFQKVADSLASIVTHLGEIDWSAVTNELGAIVRDVDKIIVAVKDVIDGMKDLAASPALFKRQYLPASWRTDEENAQLAAYDKRQEDKAKKIRDAEELPLGAAGSGPVRSGRTVEWSEGMFGAQKDVNPRGWRPEGTSESATDNLVAPLQDQTTETTKNTEQLKSLNDKLGDTFADRFGGMALPSALQRLKTQQRFAGGGERADAEVTPAGIVGDPNLTGNEYLKSERAPFAEELKNKPALKEKLAALVSLENDKDPTAVAESLMNRMAMTGGSIERGIGGGEQSFYGPVRRGQVGPRLAKLFNNPAMMDQYQKAIDAALAGSNLVKSNTDQGSRGDPNYYAGGVGVNRYGERYNDWAGGRGGVAGARAWREEHERRIHGAGAPASHRRLH